MKFSTVQTMWQQHCSLLVASLSSVCVITTMNATTNTTTSSSSCQSAVANNKNNTSTPWSSSSRLSRATPTSPIHIFRPNPFLEIAFDVRSRCPVYVLEQLQPEQLVERRSNNNNNGSNQQQQRKLRRPHFYEEKTLPEHFRSRSSHTRQQSNWDRGHMAPAGDFSYDTQLLTDTFVLTNTAPQNAVLNRGAWAALEEWTRQTAIRAWKDTTSSSSSSSLSSQTPTATKTKTIYVLTGPLWLPTRQVSDKEFEFHYSALGKPPSLISIPTHFFKVILVVEEEDKESSSSSWNDDDSNRRNTTTTITTLGAACFVLPNEPIHTDDFTPYIVPFKGLETVSGLTLFPEILTEEQKDTFDDYVVMKRLQHQNDDRPIIGILTNGSDPGGIPQRKKRRHPMTNNTTIRHLCVWK